MNVSANSIEMQLPCVPGFEQLALDAASSFAGLLGFSAQRIARLNDAVAAACLHVAGAGDGWDRPSCVQVSFSTTDCELEVRIVDDGTGDAADVRDAGRQSASRGGEPRGMGLERMRSLVDRAEWLPGPPGRGLMRLALRLDGESAAQA